MNKSWAVPVMRAGYAGRGVTYLAVAGLSLWAIWRGGEAKGTGSTLRTLSESASGLVFLLLIAVGLLAYAIWRGIDASEDLEDYGSDAKGIFARSGMIVTGLIHGAIAALAISLAFGLGMGSGGSGGVSSLTGRVLDWPGGAWIVGAAALATIGTGFYYLAKGWRAKYREHLAANPFTRNWDWALRAGVMAQGVLILIVGGFLGAAALQGSESEAGGMAKAFDWLAAQPFGNVLVVIVCVGLLGFAFFCFVNAAYRIVPKVDDDKTQRLAEKVKNAA